MKNKGITLIALVVTIVVLLILAGVSISTLTGENGIITQTQESKKKTKIGEEKDAISVAYNGCKINNIESKVTSEALETELRNNGENASVEADGNELIITFLDTNNIYSITETGKVEYKKTLIPEDREMIISAGLINEEYMYVETAAGKVKLINNTVTTIEKIDATDAIVLATNGIRKKQSNCFIDNKGKVYTWGYNSYGQIGNGTTENSSMPICISDIEENVLNGKNIVDIYADSAEVIAKDNEGKIYTWGYNGEGQLGNGTTENSSEPICISDIEENVLNGKNIVDIYILEGTVIAKDNNGKIYTWGYNSYGQLGNGTTENSSEPICISDIEENALNGKNIVDIYADSAEVIAKDDEGKIYTWGYNIYGSLGNGGKSGGKIPICISDIEESALKGKNIVDIYKHEGTVIAKDDKGKIYMWGDNFCGQFGNGTEESESIPICIEDIIEDKEIKIVVCEAVVVHPGNALEFGLNVYITTDGIAYRNSWMVYQR